MTCGWTGKILHIDVTRRTHDSLTPDTALYHHWLGGRGLAGYYLRQHMTGRNPSVDLPELPLLIFTGPLGGTSAPSSNRAHIMSWSPLTHTVGDGSMGGRFGLQLKRAGWDGLILTGRAASLCGISIVDERVTFYAAEHLRDCPGSEVIKAAGSGSGSCLATGPAADHGCLFACISADGRYYAGRSGLGAVMGGKNLKYLTVSGSGRVPVFDKSVLAEAREEILRLSAASPILQGELGLTQFGTGALYDLMHARQMMPTRNFRATRFDSAPQMNAWHYREHYGFESTGCAGCHIRCKKNSRDGREIPEFETLSHFSALIDNCDRETVMAANRCCGELGLDTITAAATIACYQEIEEKKLTAAELLSLLDDIAFSRNAGARLNQGSRRYAEQAGQPEVSMSVKHQELAAYDPRGACGMALAYVTSTRGACHLRAYPISHEILRKPVATDRFSFSGKARIIKLAEDTNAVVDSLGTCKFLFFAASLEEYARALYGATGLETTGQDLMAAGERICYQERLFNAEQGFSAADDDLPERFFREPGTETEGLTIPPLDRAQFLQARANYYRIRGLTAEGRPTKEKCRELDLPWKP